MEAYEAKIQRATARDVGDILGAVAVVADGDGKILYENATGWQALDADAPPLRGDSTFVIGSAGKFITHIAALQCVDKGLITLDEPVSTHIPELSNLNVLHQNPGPDTATNPFLLKPATKPITLRHLLSHSSGLDHESNPLIKQWRLATNQTPKEDYHPTRDARNPDLTYDTPLLYDPGKGWIYGLGIEWTTLLLTRLTQQSLPAYVDEHIFAPLGMTSSTYDPPARPDLCDRILPMVTRHDGTLTRCNYPLRELLLSISDLTTLLTSLLATHPKLLSPTSIDLLFEPQFPPESAARAAIQSDTENYVAPIGLSASARTAPVNHSLAALVLEERVEGSGFPAGTLTWNGMPNFMWAVHRGRRRVCVWGTQVLPVDEEGTVGLAMEFFRGAWGAFGREVEGR